MELGPELRVDQPDQTRRTTVGKETVLHEDHDCAPLRRVGERAAPGVHEGNDEREALRCDECGGCLPGCTFEHAPERFEFHSDRCECAVPAHVQGETKINNETLLHEAHDGRQCPRCEQLATNPELQGMRIHFGPEGDRPMCGVRTDGDTHTSEMALLTCVRCRTLVRQAGLYALGAPHRFPRAVRTLPGSPAPAYE